ncbi:hypothetical protein L6R52_27460 [Myxococcota bacterium]|nr:hypothetical protein [Myxococcota bacterium]
MRPRTWLFGAFVLAVGCRAPANDGPASDLTGRWVAAIEHSSGRIEVTEAHRLALTQRGTTVTGTVTSLDVAPVRVDGVFDASVFHLESEDGEVTLDGFVASHFEHESVLRRGDDAPEQVFFVRETPVPSDGPLDDYAGPWTLTSTYGSQELGIAAGDTFPVELVLGPFEGQPMWSGRLEISGLPSFSEPPPIGVFYLRRGLMLLDDGRGRFSSVNFGRAPAELRLVDLPGAGARSAGLTGTLERRAP